MKDTKRSLKSLNHSVRLISKSVIHEHVPQGPEVFKNIWIFAPMKIKHKTKI